MPPRTRVVVRAPGLAHGVGDQHDRVDLLGGLVRGLLAVAVDVAGEPALHLGPGVGPRAAVGDVVQQRAGRPVKPVYAMFVDPIATCGTSSPFSAIWFCSRLIVFGRMNETTPSTSSDCRARTCGVTSVAVASTVCRPTTSAPAPSMNACAASHPLVPNWLFTQTRPMRCNPRSSTVNCAARPARNVAGTGRGTRSRWRRWWAHRRGWRRTSTRGASGSRLRRLRGFATMAWPVLPSPVSVVGSWSIARRTAVSDAAVSSTGAEIRSSRPGDRRCRPRR